MKMITLLLFPTTMLIIDSFFLWLTAVTTSQDMLCHYNPNINHIPSSYKLDIFQRIGLSSVKVFHYYTIIRIFMKTMFEKFDFLDCMWIISIVNAIYSSVTTLIKSISDYNYFKKLVRCINRVFTPNQSQPGQ